MLFIIFLEKKPNTCSLHKTDKMVFLQDRDCLYKNENGIRCNIRALFNYIGNTKPLYCSNHKDTNMINIVSNKCIHINEDGSACELIASFNYITESKRLYCSKHKKIDMLNVQKKRCTIENCLEIAVYNIESESSPLYCCYHKTDIMVHKNNSVCKTFMCLSSLHNKSYEGYCSRCFSFLFPDISKERNYGCKEREVVKYIQNIFSYLTITYNRTIMDGTSKRRPDVYINCHDYSIIVEIDEYQHKLKSYGECSCENKRMLEIYQDLGEKNIVFIRFNPDSYTDFNGKKIESSWDFDDKRRLFLSNRHQWNQRLKVLEDTIEYWLENPPEKMIEIVQLFYDQNIDD